MEFYKLTAHELSELIQTKQAKAVEIAESFAQRINDVEDKVKSYITVTADIMTEEAKKVDSLIEKGEALPPLAGVPCGVKDNMSTIGVKTTAASKILNNYVPVYDATVVGKLKEAHVPMTGKTNLDEFAMGSSCENSAFFPPHNPWNLDKVPGGSSGGSAACVAADECAVA